MASTVVSQKTQQEIPLLAFFTTDAYANNALYQWWFEKMNVEFSWDKPQLLKSNLYTISPAPGVVECLQNTTRKTLHTNLGQCASILEEILNDNQLQADFIVVFIELREYRCPPYQKIQYGGIVINRRTQKTRYFKTSMEYFPYNSPERLINPPNKVSPREIYRFLKCDHTLTKSVINALNGYANDVLFES